MSLIIKARGTEGNKWRIEIHNEVWEFDSTDEMEAILKELIGNKDVFGRIDKRSE